MIEVAKPREVWNMGHVWWWCGTTRRMVRVSCEKMHSSCEMRYPATCPVCDLDGGLGTHDINEACCAIPDTVASVFNANCADAEEEGKPLAEVFAAADEVAS